MDRKAYGLERPPTGNECRDHVYALVQQVQLYGWLIDQMALWELAKALRPHCHKSYDDSVIQETIHAVLERMERLNRAWRLKNCKMDNPDVPIVVECDGPLPPVLLERGIVLSRIGSAFPISWTSKWWRPSARIL